MRNKRSFIVGESPMVTNVALVACIRQFRQHICVFLNFVYNKQQQYNYKYILSRYCGHIKVIQKVNKFSVHTFNTK